MEKKKGKGLTIVAFVIAAIACYLAGEALYQNFQLKKNIAQLEEQQRELKGSMDEQMYLVSEKEDTILADFGSEFVSADVEKRTAQVRFYVIPKSYSAEQTTASIICDGQEYPMELENGRYTVLLTVPLFEDVGVERVSFTENGISRTEVISWIITPGYEYLPYMSVFKNYSDKQGAVEGDIYTWSVKADIEVDIRRIWEGIEVEGIWIKGMVDGQETTQTEIPTAGKRDPLLNKYLSCEYALKESYEIPIGSRFILYIEMLDGDGFRHRYMLEEFRVVQGETGIVLEPTMSIMMAGSIVYDEAGNVLYGAGKDIYQ